MKLMAFSLALCVLAGYASGGRLSNLAELRIHWAGLAVVGLALQFVTGPGTAVPLACLYTSFVLLTVFAVRNLRVTGFAVILAGIALNFAVIGLNGGMPVSKHALVASGQADTYDDLVHNPYPKHHLATEADNLGFLGDVIPVPQPIGQAISIGDIVTYAGVGIVIVAGMRARGRREDEASHDSDVGELQHAGN